MGAEPNVLLRRLLEESGFSEARLAAEIRVVAAEHGHRLACGQSSVSRWLSGASPRPPAPVFLLEALSRRLGRVVTPAQAGLSKAVPASTSGQPQLGGTEPARALSALVRAELDPARRRLLTGGVYSLATLAPDLAAPPALSGAHGDAPVRPGVPPHARVGQMDAMAARFAEAAEQHGGGHVRAALAAYLAQPVTGWLRAPVGDTLHRQLLAGAARLTLLLGTMTADDGADALAQRYHHLATRLAAEADDAAAFAIALRLMATHAHDLGHRTPATVSLSERAIEASRGAPRIARAFTQAHLAVSAAHHDRHAALRALATAERLHSRADSAPGPFTAYSLAALLYQRGQTLLALGDVPGAIDAFTTSLRRRTSAERHARVLTHAGLADIRLSQGHLEAALAHWHVFLDDYPHLDSVRATRRLAAMRRRLVPHRRHRPTAALLDRARAL
ncbi:hypothetical protein QNO07_21110 [Streptomyces sp. 549]|uniref:hypothetical protein n=1 Tax=Streptomyces sp. 549 TaxID=3049076 RepID=UPI0024C3DAA5|nr:hypothetical protein [Streptomyces sp. 549]MDK1475883.1 hypothetical protein [Streptomyces sp. 549]